MFGAARLTQTGVQSASTATFWTIIDPEAIGGPWLGYYAEASSGFDFVVTQGRPTANDLAIYCLKETVSGSLSTLPTPTAFVNKISTASNYVSGYNAQTQIFMHKLTDTSNTVSVGNIPQNGADSVGIVFRPNGSYSEYVVGGVNTVIKRTGEGTLSSTLSASSQTGPLIAVAAFVSDAAVTSTSSVTTSHLRSTDISFRFLEYAEGSTGEDITFEMTNLGNICMLTTFWVKLNR